ncbi:MAG: hypothetical protein ABH854_04285 [Candidatus Diapherotrites archaeon]|nr:hypothetical protein [Candidatus Micrarchaeota archaeon]MBU1939356.1 hypothetical protein [Candidatus Micrarchaeota archaeon]
MGLRKKPGPFRGGTAGKVIQTIDAGSGFGEWVEKQAKAHPDRKYAAVDIAYRGKGFDHVSPKDYEKHARPDSPKIGKEFVENEGYSLKPEYFIKRGKELANQGIVVGASHIPAFLRWMKKTGWRARHINVDAPNVWISPKPRYSYYRSLFKEAPNILLPNGKIFIMTEKEDLVESALKLAQEYGLKARAQKVILPEGAKRTYYLRTTADPKYRVVITYGLKKAMPEKEKRKKWTQNI